MVDRQQIHMILLARLEDLLPDLVLLLEIFKFRLALEHRLAEARFVLDHSMESML